MRPLIKLILPLCALPLLASCLFYSAPKKVRPAKPRPVQVRAKLSAEERKKIEQLYYQAVDAYSKDDVSAANLSLKEIFKLDPLYAPARELTEKIEMAGKHQEPSLPPEAAPRPSGRPPSP